MENGKKIEPINSVLLLPDEIIQHIQSFLDTKQVVRTSILSKSWYNAWSTRPDLEFDQRYFSKHDHKFQIAQRFLELVKKTMHRYHQSNLRSNLKIRSFKLWMNSLQGDDYSLTKELILKAIYQMGASNLYLNFPGNLKSASAATFILPPEVLGSETLLTLSLWNCKIDLGNDGKIRCSRLKSLTLNHVFLEGDIIWDIVLSCPLIEELEIHECRVQSFNGVGTINEMLTMGPSTSPYEFKKLKFLWLRKVNIDTLFFRDFSSKFPCLKDLMIHDCYGFEEIEVCSGSLEFISIGHCGEMLKATFDVPSTCEFDFDGCFLPSLSFETASKERVSTIFIDCLWLRHSTSWFIKLQKLFKKLSSSRIYLHLHIWDIFFENSFDYASVVRGLPKPVVEVLTLSANVSCPFSSALLDCLFQSCRPKCITLCFSGLRKANWDFVEILCKTMIQESGENCYVPNRDNLGLHDLKEVNAECFDEGNWRPLSWKTLLDASILPEDVGKLRFQLKW